MRDELSQVHLEKVSGRPLLKTIGTNRNKPEQSQLADRYDSLFLYGRHTRARITYIYTEYLS